jgi:hypothetical protein
LTTVGLYTASLSARALAQRGRLDATGLYYYNARYYDATIGRFISADTYVQWSDGFDTVVSQLTVNFIPQGLGTVNSPQKNCPTTTKNITVNPQTLDRYSYVLNNPLKYTDPNGWWTIMYQLSASASLFLGCSLGCGIIFDGEGNWAIVSSTTTNIKIGIQNNSFSVSGEASITAGVQITNADTIWDVLNNSCETQITVSGGKGLAGSGTWIDGGTYQGGGLSIGIGEGFSIEGSIGIDAQVIISNKTFENFSNLTSFDYWMWGLFTMGKISGEMYINAYMAVSQGADPNWVISEIE